MASAMRIRRRRAAVVGVGALVSLACGGDDNEADGAIPTAIVVGSGSDPVAPVASTTPAMPPTGTPVTIGVVYAETGRVAGAYGMSDDVAEAWADWVNLEMGGVNGHPVEIVAADDVSTGDGAAAAGRRVVDAGAVAVIINDSSAENALADFLAERGVANIGGTANARPADSGDTHWPNLYFPVAPGSPEASAIGMIVAARAGMMNYSAVVCSEVPSCLDADVVLSSVAADVGIDYAGAVTVGAADPTYTAPCLAIIEAAPDVIGLSLAPATILGVVEDCALQGYDGAFASSYNAVIPADLEDIEGLRMVGGLNGFPWWAEAPAAQRFRDVMESYAPDLDYRASSATIMWSSLELFRKAMTEGGPPSESPVAAADVIAAYHAIDGETLDGLLPQPITFVTEGHQPGVKCFWPFRLDAGNFSVVEIPGESGNGESGDLRSVCFSLEPS